MYSTQLLLTSTLTVALGACAGDKHSKMVDDPTVAALTSEPNLHAAAVTKFAPLTVTIVDPEVGPDSGSTVNT